jgi:hypothetical protein
LHEQIGHRRTPARFDVEQDQLFRELERARLLVVELKHKRDGLFRISRVCFKSTASVSNQPRLFRISRVRFESAASVSNQLRPFRISCIRFESTAGAL